LDPYLREDVPCLREMQLRCPEDEEGNLVLNMNTMWRSRDLFKAWPDNVVAITFMQRMLAAQIAEKSRRTVRVGSYADYSASLHIYGQDFGAVGGDAARGLQSFFDTFDEESYMARALTSEMAAEMLVIPQLKALLGEERRGQWQFPDASVALIERLIGEMESGTYTP
jgi:hypothetical protein